MREPRKFGVDITNTVYNRNERRRGKVRKTQQSRNKRLQRVIESPIPPTPEEADSTKGPLLNCTTKVYSPLSRRNNFCASKPKTSLHSEYLLAPKSKFKAGVKSKWTTQDASGETNNSLKCVYTRNFILALKDKYTDKPADLKTDCITLDECPKSTLKGKPKITATQAKETPK